MPGSLTHSSVTAVAGAVEGAGVGAGVDGDAAGAKPSEMGPVIFGWKGETGGAGDSATKSAYESLQAAKKYVARNYLVIPQMNFHSG